MTPLQPEYGKKPAVMQLLGLDGMSSSRQRELFASLKANGLRPSMIDGAPIYRLAEVRKVAASLRRAKI